jgi:spore maturation protein CgeB/ubiquinone/menaquinone biosynthesis C-methylase UbiE
MQGHNEDTIDIHDRVAQAYYGELGEKLQYETQNRLHWIRDNVVGDHILDVGCSQGIGPILLARQGKTVLGVDISQQAVDEAKIELEKENDNVKENVNFIVSDFLELDIDKNQFTTITITEVLEHLYHPEEFIEKAHSLLKDNGRLIVTVPFGINDFPDHKKTYYFHDLYTMLFPYFEIFDISYMGKWIGFIGTKRKTKLNTIPNNIPLKTLQSLEQAFYTIERELVDENESKIKLLNNCRKVYKEVSTEKTKLLQKIQEIPELKNQLNDCRKKFREISAEKTELLAKVRKIQELKEQLDAKLLAVSDKLTQIQHQLQLCYASASYRLGHVLLHEKKTLLNPVSILKKINTVRKMRKKPITSSPQTTALKKLEKAKTPLMCNIKVAILCDEFSYNSWRYEFDAIIFEPNNWQEIFEREKPELFFCESAWAGIDSKKRSWRGQVYASINFKKENRTELLNILKYCKSNNIPTIFWNKEDPTHYKDKVHNFVDTAIKFDYIFTTAEECIDMYKNEYHCKNVYCLPFATQPKLFNPIEKYERSDAVVFAGSWYAQHPDRCTDMEKLFDAILDNNKELIIYDRHYGTEDTNHHFPEKYKKFIHPGVPHHEIDKVYKSSIYGLNINTVKNSTSMFARRVFELMSSNTFVLSNNSLGMKKFFGDRVVYLDENPDNLNSLTQEEVNEVRDRNLHDVLENHTYHHRFKEILNNIDFSYQDIDLSITVVIVIKNRYDIEKAFSLFQEQIYNDKKLLLVLSDQIPEEKLASYYTTHNNNDSATVALSYLKRYEADWSYVIETPYFCLLKINSSLPSDILKKAMLHTSYTELPIKIGSEKKYSITEQTVSVNIISKKNDFKYFLLNYNEKISGRFYHV